MSKLSLGFAASVFSLLLVACGGGGGGSGAIDDDLGDDGSGGIEAPTRSTLSGVINVAPSSDIDSDTGDTTSEQIANNSIATAQAIANPVTLGGFVEFANSGDGCQTSSATFDSIDFFRTELFGGQIIQLTIADLDFADLDLFLLNDQDEIVDSSVAANANESVRVPDNADGQYTIAVCAFQGESNYIVGVGQAEGGFEANSANSSYRTSNDFIVGEAVLDWEEGVEPATVLERGLPNAKMLVNGPTSDLLSVPAQQRSVAARGWSFANAELAARHATLMSIKALAKMPGVLCAEPNFRRQASAIPNDPGYPRQWHYPLISLPSAWDTTVGSASVITAVIDTGVLLSHPDLQGQFDPNDPNGYDFISDVQTAGDGNGRDGNANDVGDESPGGSSYHGTHVAGTVAAAGDNGVGVAGVAYGSKIMPLRVLGIGGGSSFDTTQAVLYAAGLSNASGRVPTRRADVINLSLGGGGFSQSEQNAFTNARNEGVIIIAAAGNENSSRPSYPAAYNGVVSVSAVDIQRRLAPYSNFGSTIDVAAPGGDASRDRDGDGFGDGVLSTGGDDSTGSVRSVYPFQQGTSMAAPHVAGVAALMKSVHSGLTPNDFDALLMNGSIVDDIGPVGRDSSFGHGLINARKAVSAAVRLAGGEEAPTTPILSASPRSLGFASGVSELSFELSNSGDGELTVTSVSDDATWLTVAPSEIDGSGLGAYAATAQRAGLADGTYQADITVTSSANTVVISALLQVGAPIADVGVQYVLLVDEQTNAVVGQDRVEVSGGEYRYRFNNVENGNYMILSGTDSDDDNVICDAGEACGGYITLDQPLTVQVRSADRNNLNFVSGFEAQLNQSSSNQPNSYSLGVKNAE